MATDQAIFGRSELLLGSEAMERIAGKSVIIFGVGGVGSWCAESLVRSGIRRLTIVDSDCVCITTRGKPIKAKTVGQKRYVEAIRKNTIVLGVGDSLRIRYRQL